MKWYKIFEDGKTNPRTLFHGVNGSRNLPLNKWIKAKMGIGSEGGTKYRTGFHILNNLTEIKDYSRKFKLNNRVIVEVQVDNKCRIWRKKHSNHNVFLAERIRIKDKDWENRMKFKRKCV